MKDDDDEEEDEEGEEDVTFKEATRRDCSMIFRFESGSECEGDR